METKLDMLRNVVAQMFEHATEKEQIENLAKLNNSIDEVAKEQEELTSKNAELIKSYKELIKHTSFKEQPNLEAQSSVSVPSLEESLAKFLASQPEEK